MQILVLTQSHPRRAEAERFIADVYRLHYQASVPTFPPTLVGLFGTNGQCLCASGLRYAETGFFSECYLDQPIEVLLGDATGKPVQRERIFEVSGLSSRAPQRAAQFLRYVVAYGENAGFDWAFFTATKRLRGLLCVLGLPPLILGRADRVRAQDAQAWGSYYDSEPLVCAISRADAQAYLDGLTRSAVHA